MKRLLFAACLVLAGCSSQSVELAGTYYLSTLDCDGVRVVVGGGYKESIAFGTEGRATYRSATPDCVHKTSVDFTIDGSTLNYTTLGTICTEGLASEESTECALSYSIAGATVSQECRNVSGATGSIEIAGDGNRMTGAFEVNGTSCVATYVR